MKAEIPIKYKKEGRKGRRGRDGGREGGRREIKEGKTKEGR